MPWLRIPFSQEERRQKLARALDVQAIPTLVILDPRDNIITLEGRAELLENPEGLVIFTDQPSLLVNFNSKLTLDVIECAISQIHFVATIFQFFPHFLITTDL